MPMGSPSGDPKGQPLPQNVPPNGTKPNEHGEGEKNSYTNTLIDNPSSAAASLEQQSVKSKRNFHNGMHAVIFKTRDYYGVMASQCLPFHMHNWHFIKHIVSHVGTPLELDTATKRFLKRKDLKKKGGNSKRKGKMEKKNMDDMETMAAQPDNSQSDATREEQVDIAKYPTKSQQRQK
ncbi:hypothetical protein HAX54_017184 [Datura stramonium]|uniref:Uncharacterized protein n=1 Tax=Datura stramonium TaxID=4076 RepID=A0ABS8UM93_DATST|nr:hypothetical protein [Datura stramonium]